MTLTDVFHIMGILAFITISAVVLFVAYEVYKFKLFLMNSISGVSKAFKAVAVSRYGVQYVISKFLLGILGGGDKNGQ